MPFKKFFLKDEMTTAPSLNEKFPNATQVVLVGGLPNPIGGISNFMSRLIRSDTALFSEILDPYPSGNKEVSPIPHKILKTRFFGLFYECMRMDGRHILFNFSTWRSLLLFVFLPKKSNRWGLILFHGKIHFSGLALIMKPLVSYALSKFDAVGYVSSEQADFYKSYASSSVAQIPLRFYIECDKSQLTNSESDLPKIINDWKMEGRRLYIVSGYPTKIYQHQRVIDAIKKVNENSGDVALALFLYGKDDDGLMSQIRSDIEGRDDICMFWAQSELNFMKVLAVADGYIRMNTIDSFGVAIADAINLGVPVLATNVCPRYSGAICIDPDDDDSLLKFINGISIEKSNDNEILSQSLSIHEFIRKFINLEAL